MNIQKATEMAVKENRYITAPIDGYIGFKIKPTNGEEGCIITLADGTHNSKHGWQPKAIDLMRDNWMLID